MSKKLKGWREIPIGGIIPEPGSSALYKTGSWRAIKPVIDLGKCKGCLICWIHCPEPAIRQITVSGELKVEINYDYCKGCGICANVCPFKAIDMVPETG
ncbi:MAG: 4Fe-4S binding protein [Candidatus Asgardarchaeia archaeon]